MPYISLIIVLLIGIPLLTLVGAICFMFGACMCKDKLPELPVTDLVIPIKSCQTCRHSTRGELNCRDSNCAECMTTYAFAGYERSSHDD